MAHQPVRQEHDGVMQLPQAPDYESCQGLESHQVADSFKESESLVVPPHDYIRPFAEDVGVWILGSVIAPLGIESAIAHHFVRDPFCFGHLKTPFCELGLLNHHSRGLSIRIFCAY